MKKIISIIIAVCILVSVFSIPASAVRYETCAETLDKMGIFKGVTTDWGVDYELGRGAKRVEALVMLLRLIGKEKSALAYQSSQKFSDVPTDHWAHSYISYAYKNGYTSGVSSTKFAPDSEVTLNAYATFLLRALGYNDSKGDFSYDKAIEKAEKVGLLIKGTYKDGNAVCLRDDCAYMTLRALTTKKNGSKSTLADDLVSKGVIPKDSLNKALSTLKTADKEITNAQINNHPIKVEDLHIYSEYNSSGNIINSLNIEAFYNPLWRHRTEYKYDKNGNYIGKYVSDGVRGEHIYDFEYDSKNRLSYIKYYNSFLDYTHYYKLVYSEKDNKLLKIENKDDSGEYLEFKYDGDCITVNYSGEYNDINYLFGFFLDYGEVINVKSKKLIDKSEEINYTYNSQGVIKNKTDSNGNTTYSMEKNEYGAIKNQKTYQYSYDSGAGKSYLESKYKLVYSYNYDGSVAKVQGTEEYYYYDTNQVNSKIVTNYDKVVKINKKDETFTFRYFGNGKLDRVLCKSVDGVTWEQYNTIYSDKGNLTDPRIKM